MRLYIDRRCEILQRLRNTHCCGKTDSTTADTSTSDSCSNGATASSGKHLQDLRCGAESRGEILQGLRDVHCCGKTDSTTADTSTSDNSLNGVAASSGKHLPDLRRGAESRGEILQRLRCVHGGGDSGSNSGSNIRGNSSVHSGGNSDSPIANGGNTRATTSHRPYTTGTTSGANHGDTRDNSGGTCYATDSSANDNTSCRDYLTACRRND